MSSGGAKIAITGATGHLGVNLVRDIQNAPDDISEIRVITRRRLSDEEIARFDARRDPGAGDHGAAVPIVPVLCELSDIDGLAQAFAGCDIVFSCAARVMFGVRNDRELERVNMEGSVNVARAAIAAGVRRLVHVGSIEAYPLSDGNYPITEAQGIHPENTVLEYGRTKAAALMAIQEMVRADGLDAVFVCPTGFIGPYDYRRSPMGRMILDFLRRKLPAYVRGGFDFVDVRDVARAVRLAATHGGRGEEYLIGGHFVEVPELMMRLEAHSGVSRPPLCLPVKLIIPFMPIVEAYYRRRGVSPRFTRDSLELLSLGATVSTEKAREQLGYRPRPIDDTLRDTVAWFRTHLGTL